MDTTPITRLTIVYDNNPPTTGAARTDPPLLTDWGFACLVEHGETTLLFDTGSDAATLKSNLKALDIDPADIDVLVLSHYHSDHTGGIDTVLDAGKPIVFAPASFPADFKARVAQSTHLVEVTGPTEIAEGIRTTGEMGTEIIEQSLMVETGEGLVVITGCAHPGIVEIARSATQVGEVHLLLGGFHLRDEDAAGCDAVVSAIYELGVRRVAPTHCTGDICRSRFAAAYGDHYVPAGVGTVVEIAE